MTRSEKKTRWSKEPLVVGSRMIEAELAKKVASLTVLKIGAGK